MFFVNCHCDDWQYVLLTNEKKRDELDHERIETG